MKKSVFLAIVMLGAFTATVSAKKLPTVAAKLPGNFKQEIVKQIDYPKFAKNNNIEGEVWMKVTVDEQEKVRIVDLSATNQELGEHVKSKLKDVTVKNSGVNGDVFYLKVRFDLRDK